MAGNASASAAVLGTGGGTHTCGDRAWHRRLDSVCDRFNSAGLLVDAEVDVIETNAVRELYDLEVAVTPLPLFERERERCCTHCGSDRHFSDNCFCLHATHQS